MALRYISAVIILSILLLSAAGCGYRFVDPFPASDYALVSVRNATEESDLAHLIEEELRRSGGFKERSTNRLSVTVTDFAETVESVDSDGIPVRQKLTMEVAWKVEGTQATQATFGQETIVRSYPFSTDPPTLDFNRSSALRLLSEMAARTVLERLGGPP